MMVTAMTTEERHYGELPEPPYHTRKDLVEMKIGCLRKIDDMRSKDEGPPPLRIGGAIRYPENWLKRWLMDQAI